MSEKELCKKAYRALVAMDKALKQYGSTIHDLFGNDEKFLKARELAEEVMREYES